MRRVYKKVPPPIFGTAKNQIPGYGGFVPNVQSKNMYGKTQYDATTEALAMHYAKHAEYDEKKPKTAPAMASSGTASTAVVPAAPAKGPSGVGRRHHLLRVDGAFALVGNAFSLWKYSEIVKIHLRCSQLIYQYAEDLFHVEY